jgi:hypothetical protein
VVIGDKIGYINGCNLEISQTVNRHISSLDYCCPSGRTDLDAQELGWKKNQYETQAKSQKFVNDIFMMRIELNFKWS